MSDCVSQICAPTVSLDAALERLEVGIASVGPEETPGDGEWGVIRLGAVTSGQFDPAKAKRLPASVAPRPTLEIQQGDVLVVRVNGSRDLVGSVCVVGQVPPRLMLSDLVMRLVADTDIMDPRFLGVVLSVESVRSQILARLRGTSGQFQLPQSEIKSMLVPCPSLPEQRRIVDIIDAVSAQERAIETSITKLNSMMSGALDAMLDEFAWDHTLAGATDGAIRNGFSPVESEVWTGVQMLGLGCLTPAGFEPSQLKNAPSFVAAEHAAMLRDGDLLMSRANTRELVGLAGVYRDVGSPCIYPDLMMRIRPSKRCSVDFLAAVLKSPRVRRHIRSMAQGTSESMVKISASAVRGIPVPLPSLEEQSRVLEVLCSLSLQTDAEIEELAKLQALRLGLVDDLLAGKV